MTGSCIKTCRTSSRTIYSDQSIIDQTNYRYRKTGFKQHLYMLRTPYMFRVATAVYQAGVKTRMTHRAGACKGLDFTWNSASIWNRAIYTIHCTVLDFTYICNPLLIPLNCHRPWHYQGCRFHTACDKSFSNPFFSCVTVWHAGSCSRYSQQTMQINFSRVEQFKLPAEGFVTNDPRIGWPMVNDHSVFAIYYSLSSTQYLKIYQKPFNIRLKWRERPIWKWYLITFALHEDLNFSALQQLNDCMDRLVIHRCSNFGETYQSQLTPLVKLLPQATERVQESHFHQSFATKSL